MHAACPQQQPFAKDATQPSTAQHAPQAHPPGAAPTNVRERTSANVGCTHLPQAKHTAHLPCINAKVAPDGLQQHAVGAWCEYVVMVVGAAAQHISETGQPGRVETRSRQATTQKNPTYTQTYTAGRAASQMLWTGQHTTEPGGVTSKVSSCSCFACAVACSTSSALRRSASRAATRTLWMCRRQAICGRRYGTHTGGAV